MDKNETPTGSWHSVPAEFRHKLDDFEQPYLEGMFNEMNLQTEIDNMLMYGADGKPSMVNTAWVAGAFVYIVPEARIGGVAANIVTTAQGWKINVADDQSPQEIDFSIGHELGHLMTFKHSLTTRRRLFPSTEELPEAEVLCDYISARMLGYITLRSDR